MSSISTQTGVVGSQKRLTWLTEQAIVYGRARLSDNVRVEGTAQVSGNAELTGDALVCGNRWIDGNFKASTGVYRENPKVQTKAQRLRPAEDGLNG